MLWTRTIVTTLTTQHQFTPTFIPCSFVVGFLIGWYIWCILWCVIWPTLGSKRINEEGNWRRNQVNTLSNWSRHCTTKQRNWMGLERLVEEAKLDAADTHHAPQLQAVLFLIEWDNKWNFDHRPKKKAKVTVEFACKTSLRMDKCTSTCVDLCKGSKYCKMCYQKLPANTQVAMSTAGRKQRCTMSGLGCSIYQEHVCTACWNDGNDMHIK